MDEKSVFPEFANCSTCEARWPKPILDNAGRCPQCGLDHVLSHDDPV